MQLRLIIAFPKELTSILIPKFLIILMKFKGNYLFQYLMLGPMSLAICRTLECETLSEEKFDRPILDIGCGDGHFSDFLFAESVDVGIDPQAREISKARVTSAYKELIVCPGDSIPKSDGSFRTIFSNSVLEHISDVKPVLIEAARLLASDGRFLITIPTNKVQTYTPISRLLRALGLANKADSFESCYNSFWKHYNVFSVEEWETLFSECGLKVIEKSEYCPKTLVAWFDCLLPFAFPGYLWEKITGRWLISRNLRQLYLPLPYTIVNSLLNRYRKGPGAYAFFALGKHNVGAER